jgi:hypothetical protein
MEEGKNKENGELEIKYKKYGNRFYLSFYKDGKRYSYITTSRESLKTFIDFFNPQKVYLLSSSDALPSIEEFLKREKIPYIIK